MNSPGPQGNLEPPNYSFVNLEDNERREIDNPLARQEPAQIRHDARRFAHRHFPREGLSKLFVKAALVARDPLSFESVEGLTTKERDTLSKETTTSFWAQPKGLRVTTITLCVAAIIQGWNQTGSNGANLNWPTAFGLADRKGQLNDTKATWIFAAVNAVTYFAASLVGCWLSDPLNEFAYGRRGAIFLSGLFCLASVIGGACTHSWRQLFACRFLLGVGMGSKASVTPIMGAEVSPAHLRGSLVRLNVLSVMALESDIWCVVRRMVLTLEISIFLGFSSNLVVSHIGPLGWRFQTAAAFLPAIVLLSLILVCPESPRFLLKKGRYREAYRSLLQLRETPLQAARDLYYMNCQLQAEAMLISSNRGELRPGLELGQLNHQNGPGVTGSETSSNTESEDGGTPDNPPQAQGDSWWKRAWRGLVEFTKDLRIRGNPEDLDGFQREVQHTGYITRFAQLFRKKRIRRATVAAAVVMISQQLCGVGATLSFDASPRYDGS
ncbi:hypothetical protein GP486_006212 [Trichoglossum hirsutum]|uniref:Major facilitator superfamily (MFS) profile domain-containing protein n=1 Tax=Trichoglossum hirsutum TaxID=265104 RepID=A0A9P8L3X0_9PEZI|nr:hypothetical protein GP486_006212 [Trichoglossum hirsutum]